MIDLDLLLIVTEVPEAMMPETIEELEILEETFMVETTTTAAETDTVQGVIQVHQGQKE